MKRIAPSQLQESATKTYNIEQDIQCVRNRAPVKSLSKQSYADTWNEAAVGLGGGPGVSRNDLFLLQGTFKLSIKHCMSLILRTARSDRKYMARDPDYDQN